MENKNIEIANTILKQMGGAGKIKAMAGVKHFIALDNGVSFNFKMNPKMNQCKITLNGMDTYDIEFFKIAPMPKYTEDQTKYNKAWEKMQASYTTPVKKIDGVYNDMLKQIFEETTGLYLSF